MMTAQRILYLGVETISRELDSCVLLAHEMMERDWVVVLGSRSQVWRASETLGSGVLVQTSGERGERYPARPDTFPDLRLVQYHQEGLAPRSDEELLSRYPAGLDFVDRIFTFGSSQTVVLQGARPHLADRFVPVGSPRFDLLGPRYRQVLARPDQFQHRQPYILINTAFKAGNSSRLYRAGFEERFAHNESSAWGRDVLERRRHVQRQHMDHYVSLVGEIVGMQRDIGVVVRPHPSEDHDTWRERLAGFPNIAVEYRDSAVEWIDHAQVLVHTGCTTGVEARFLGRRALRFNPLAAEVDEPQLPNLVSEPVDTAAQVVEIAHETDLDRRVELTRNERDIVLPYLASASGASSVMLIAAELDRLAQDHPSPDVLARLHRAMTFHPRSIAARGMRTARRVRRKVAGAQSRRIGEQKFPTLDLSRVANRLAALEAIDGRRAARVKSLGHHVIGMSRSR